MTNNEIKYFHFTHRKNLKSILANGLTPRIGANSISAEDTPKIFFSEGQENALKCLDVWLKWNMVRISRDTYTQNAVAGINPNESSKAKAEYERKFSEALEKHKEKVISGRIGDSSLLKALSFEMMYQEWKQSVYLSLDLKERTHFSYSDKDDAKQRMRSEQDKAFLQYMYGEYENPNGLEKWNMHTLSSVSNIPPDAIKQIGLNGQTDALTIATKLYQDNKKQIDKKFPILTEWFEYCSAREDEKDAKPNALDIALADYKQRKQDNPHYTLKAFDSWLDTMGMTIDGKQITQPNNNKNQNNASSESEAQ